MPRDISFQLNGRFFGSIYPASKVIDLMPAALQLVHSMALKPPTSSMEGQCLHHTAALLTNALQLYMVNIG